MMADTYANIIGARVGHKKNNVDVNLNATVIKSNGRFLMPREWGREPFYTSLPRERNEGAGAVKAVLVRMTYAIPGIRLRPSLGIGFYDMPDLDNHRQNKYGMPSFGQLNADVRYNFSGYLEGAGVQFLYTYKLGVGNDYENPKNIINKVNMSNFNLVLNYKFENYHSLDKKTRAH
jgi:hypothetical protein